MGCTFYTVTLCVLDMGCFPGNSGWGPLQPSLCFRALGLKTPTWQAGEVIHGTRALVLQAGGLEFESQAPT